MTGVQTCALPICADIMNNQLEKPIGILRLPEPLKLEYETDIRLKDLIEKPLWTITGEKANDTLIPDLISIKDDQFIIFDAKYYNAQLEPGRTPKCQPGIEAITKQYLYQLAYQDFIKKHGFSVVRNCFLMPTEKHEIIDKGEVSMKMFSHLALQNIKVRFIPASMAYDHYLSGKKMDFEILKF